MASSDQADVGNDFIKVMETFPCSFNIGMMKKPSRVRLQLMIRSLNSDLLGEEEKYDGERMTCFNVLSWLYFQSGDIEEALSKNDEALILSTDNLVALGNRAFLEWYRGSDLSTFLSHLENLKLEDDFPEKRMQAKAHQADLLFRLGGAYNMSSSIQIYGDLIEKGAENVNWKYNHCLALRRLATMTHNKCDDRTIEASFRDIAENATGDYWKSAAMSELAIFLASNNSQARAVEELVEKALLLDAESPVVRRKCGMALSRLGNPRSIHLLEQSLALKNNTVSRHALAKCYSNYRLTRNLDPNECDRQSVANFQAAYDLSEKENIRPLVDLAFLHRTKNRFEESLRLYSGLINNWGIREIHTNPFMLSKICEGFFYSLQKTGGRRQNPFFERYLLIALSTMFEQFKRTASPNDKSSFFYQVANPVGRRVQNSPFKSLLILMNESNSNEHSARQKLVKLQQQRKLESRHVVEEAELLLEGDGPGEALLLLDMAQLHMQVEAKQLEKKALVEEARWELSQGLISCKLLFHRLFDLSHSDWGSSAVPESVDSVEKDLYQSTEADVLILQDGRHWRPFLQDSSDYECGQATLDIDHQNQMYQEVMEYLFDLDTICNPWLSFSGGNQPDTEEFLILLKQFRVQLVLLVVDKSTSSKFLQMVDFLLSTSLQGKQADLAIIYSDKMAESNARPFLPNLADVTRCFKADENGFTHREGSKSVTDLVGTEMVDAYFSDNIDNVMKFFEILAP